MLLRRRDFFGCFLNQAGTRYFFGDQGKRLFARIKYADSQNIHCAM